MFDYHTAEQRAIHESVTKLGLSLFAHGKEPTPRQLFSEFSKLGLAGLGISSEYGGLGEGMVTSTMVMQALASINLGPAIFISVHGMVAGLIERFGDTSQKEHYLPRLARGELLAAFALTESQAGSDASALKMSATRDGDDYILNGSKIYITSGGFADLYIVFAKTAPDRGAKGISAFLVEHNAPGLSFGAAERKMGCKLSPICSLFFDNVRIPRSALIGGENAGYSVALGGLAGGRINIAACANGLSSTAIERARQFMKERSQFGKPIAEFQGLQFMLADMKILLEAAELLTWQAAQERDTRPESAHNTTFPSYAKCFATDAAMKITTDAVQLFGGAGYLEDHGVEQLMRDAKMLQIVEGTNQIQRVVVAREILR